MRYTEYKYILTAHWIGSSPCVLTSDCAFDAITRRITRLNLRNDVLAQKLFSITRQRAACKLSSDVFPFIFINNNNTIYYARNGTGIYRCTRENKSKFSDYELFKSDLCIFTTWWITWKFDPENLTQRDDSTNIAAIVTTRLNGEYLIINKCNPSLRETILFC